MKYIFSVGLFFIFSCGSLAHKNKPKMDELKPKEMLKKIDEMPLIEEDHC